jgi:hypothetical protein
VKRRTSTSVWPSSSSVPVGFMRSAPWSWSTGVIARMRPVGDP